MQKSDSTPNGHLNDANNSEGLFSGAKVQNGQSLPVSNSADLVANFVKIADAHFARKDFKASGDSLLWALNLKPNDPEILIMLATVHFYAGDFPAACRVFRQAIELDPKSARLHAQLAAACFKAGDPAGAKTALEQAFALDPNCPEALRLQAKLNEKEAPAAQQSIIPNLVTRHANGSALEARNNLLPPVANGTNGANGRHNGSLISHPPRRLTIPDIVRENPALHRDHEGRPIHMPVSEAVAKFIQNHIKAGNRTVETGAGMSTLCFLAQGAFHTAIAPDSGMEQRLRAYCQEHAIADKQLTYIPKTSQDAVWALEGEFDCALIDGGHGFPVPFIDFFYFNEHLKRGGYLIIDDLEIWTGEILAKFLSCEPAWKVVIQDGCRSIIFQKVGDARPKDWFRQDFVVRNSLHPTYLEVVIPREKLASASGAN